MKSGTNGYLKIHRWVEKVLGTPNRCDRCKTTEYKKYEWANISREYKQDVTDWERLCSKCHAIDGRQHNEFPSRKGIAIPRINKEKKNKIIADYKEGMSVKDILTQHNIAQGSLYRIIKNNK